jgi:hypothetical protein
MCMVYFEHKHLLLPITVWFIEIVFNSITHYEYDQWTIMLKYRVNFRIVKLIVTVCLQQHLGQYMLDKMHPSSMYQIHFNAFNYSKKKENCSQTDDGVIFWLSFACDFFYLQKNSREWFNLNFDKITPFSDLRKY